MIDTLNVQAIPQSAFAGSTRLKQVFSAGMILVVLVALTPVPTQAHFECSWTNTLVCTLMLVAMVPGCGSVAGCVATTGAASICWWKLIKTCNQTPRNPAN